jgi:hypothetical protein
MTDQYSAAGRPVSQYGLLWEACTHSFPYLSKQLAHISCNVNVPIDDPSWIPFSIPVIIKQLLGDVLTYIYFSCSGVNTDYHQDRANLHRLGL